MEELYVQTGRSLRVWILAYTARLGEDRGLNIASRHIEVSMLDCYKLSREIVDGMRRRHGVALPRTDYWGSLVSRDDDP